MDYKRMKDKIGVVLIIIGIFTLVSVFLSKPKEEIIEPVLNADKVSTSTEIATQVIVNDTKINNDIKGSVIETFNLSANLKIDLNDFELRFNDGEVLFDVLNRLRLAREIDFGGKEYSGLGFFVERINELKPGKGESLILFVNNKKADVGVSGYKLKKGDLIEFKVEDNY